MKTLVLICFLIASIYCASKPFTYFVYDRTLPATLCRDVQCKKQYMHDYDGKSFGQHGLWPSGAQGDHCYQPKSCNKIWYKESLLNSDVKSFLDAYFFGSFYPSKKFRGHEFQKHGTCMMEANSMNQKDFQNWYFKQVEIVQTKYDLINALSKGGIVPHDTDSYTFEEIEYALESELENNGQKFDVNIRCIKIDGKQYMAGIQLYLDLDFQLTRNMCKVQKESRKKKFLRNLLNDRPTTVFPCNQNQEIMYPVFHFDQNVQ